MPSHASLSINQVKYKLIEVKDWKKLVALIILIVGTYLVVFTTRKEI